jgi:predicted nucleotidyltransferase
VLLAVASGSTACGFESPDSDFEYGIVDEIDLNG